MAAKRVSQTFSKYTLEPKGIWKRISNLLSIDSGRSSGVPLNPLFRNPAPASNDPTLYSDPITVPAADLAENPYWKRDTRRAYPKLSVVNQSDIVGLLTVGNKASPKDDVLQIGDAGSKQLVALKEDSAKTGLAVYFEKEGAKSVASVLGPGGLPPMPANLLQSTQGQNGKRYEMIAGKEQSYGKDLYPCRSFV